jgi:hypothetical protein
LERVPAKAQRLVRSCLKKDPKQRLQAIGDWGLLLDEEQAAPAKARDTKILWIAAGVLAVALSIAPWAPWRSEKPVDRPLVRLDVDLGADVSLPAPGSSGISVVISPDGTRLVYASGTPVKLFTRRLDQPKATELPGTHGASNAFFSPDGQWVGFYSNGRVNKISVEGGAVVPLADITGFYGASWGEDGSVIAGGSLNKGGLLRIPAGGGQPKSPTTKPPGPVNWPSPGHPPGTELCSTAGPAAARPQRRRCNGLIPPARRNRSRPNPAPIRV